MNKRAWLSLLIILVGGFTLQAQNGARTTAPAQTRPRTVNVAPTPAASSPATVSPQSVTTPPETGALPRPDGGAIAQPVNNTAVSLKLGIDKIRARITEAERVFKTRPVPTSIVSPVRKAPTAPLGTSTTATTAPMTAPVTPPPVSTSSVPSIDFVTIAALDASTSKIHFVTLPKTLFLKKGAEANITTSEGTLVKLRVLRANGVNTAVTIFDGTGRSLAPLVVQYPIERGGRFLEMAYYTSAHPALLSPDVVKAGQSYVRTMIDLAAKRLELKGKKISPELLDIAERLCVVEHTDHDRYRRENRLALYEEIFALFALNELDTYRYAVSWAGAGGMVQMIPSTYRMVRTAHPGVGLNPDFVAGMRNHGNALEAMLLYMQDTWDDLSQREDVIYALNAKIATQTELVAAGYNSNPARLPGYIKRGGAAWRTLIPRETQLYLQIYRSLESLIPMKPRG